MKHWTSIVLKGAVYTLMLLLSCGLLFGCQDQKEAVGNETPSAVWSDL